ncbi:alpha/beta hydrolase [Pseudomonas sp. FW300-N2A2]|jgi:esterase/lipase superfamily enzyme|uniref:alpha/beta hydrolase n=1 Tax=Pseudomonas sp. FW300-N2A2 TaxID=2751316 RepID=UPI001A912779|nr:alpha/beta hydrolase [Pseudomonas sp. FW300-N2A2]
MEAIARSMLVTALTFLTACSAALVAPVDEPPPEPVPAVSVEEPPPSSIDETHNEFVDKMTGIVTVFFASNRNIISDYGCVDSLGKKRGKSLVYGYCHVKIPFNHKTGIIESPSWFKLEWTEDPEKHVSIVGGGVVAKAEFEKLISHRLKENGTTFIYVHGYNVSFEDAAKRTAQMAYDLDFKGVPAFYSWPSAGNPKNYVPDEAAAEAAKTKYYNFLVDYLKNPNVKGVYLIAHSMGNRAVAAGLVTLNVQHPELRAKIKEVILAAPDIDSDVFADEIVPGIESAKWPVTMYASDKDMALLASKTYHNYPRAGYISDNLIVMPGIDTVDASLIKTDFLSHSYYGDSTTLIYDIYNIINTGARADKRRNLSKINDTNGIYWRFTP